MESPKPRPLAGRTIAIPETRELSLFADMLEQKGATTVRCPLISIEDSADTESVVRWLTKLADGAFHDLILLTGEGLRRLIGFARRAGMEERVIAALQTVRKITRGPKPARALRELKLTPDLAANPATTDGVISVLAQHELTNRSVGLQLYADEPNTKLVQFLEQAGASVHVVAPYRYVPATDSKHVLDLIDRMAQGEIDAIAFTSAPQVTRLWSVAESYGVIDRLQSALARTRVAAVGPVVAEELREHAITPQIMPQSSFSMGRLAHEIACSFSP